VRSINHSNKIITIMIIIKYYILRKKWKPYTRLYIRDTTKYTNTTTPSHLYRQIIYHRHPEDSSISIIHIIYAFRIRQIKRPLSSKYILWVAARTVYLVLHQYILYICIIFSYICIPTLIKRRIYLSQFSRRLFARPRGCARA